MHPARPASRAPRTSGSAACPAATGAGRKCCCPQWTSELSPDLFRGVDAELQFRLLLLDGEIVAVVRAGEAALRRETQVLERDEFRGLLDTLLELILGFELRCFRGNEPKHHLLALPHVAQRLEAARALVVELEEEGIDVERR